MLSGVDNSIILISLFTGLFFSLLNVSSSLFILLEKKWAILFALDRNADLLLSWGYSIYKMLLVRVGNPTVTILTFPVFLMSLKIPYLIMLLRIKRDWETTGRGGKMILPRPDLFQQTKSGLLNKAAILISA